MCIIKNATSFVILDKCTYVDNVEEFISSNNFKKVDYYPKIMVQIKMENALKIFIDTIVFLDYNSKYLININPYTWRFHNFTENNKLNLPNCLVVSFITSLDIRYYFDFELWQWETSVKNKVPIKHSLDLINKIKDIKFPENKVLVSFEVWNFFPLFHLQTAKNSERNILKWFFYKPYPKYFTLSRHYNKTEFSLF